MKGFGANLGMTAILCAILGGVAVYRFGPRIAGIRITDSAVHRYPEGSSFPASIDALHVSPIDFGKVRWGSELIDTAVVRNLGNVVLTVKSVELPCGCGALRESDFVGRTLTPGAELEIPFSIRVPMHPGEKLAKIGVVCDNQVSAVVPITMEAVASWTLSADVLDFGVAADNSAQMRAIAFSSSECFLKSITMLGSGAFEVESQETTGGDVAVTFVAAASRMRPVLNLGFAVFQTDCADKPEAVVYLRAHFADKKGTPNEATTQL